MKKRWLLAISAVGIHLSIGSIYAWSQIASAIVKQHPGEWTLTQITLCFGIAIFFLGVATLLTGHFVERRGPKVSGIVAAVLFAIGLVGGGIAVHINSLWLLYLTYGVLGGLGIGIGYITPVSTLLKWFPDHRGFAMGLTIMGFGFGAAIEVLLLQNLFPLIGIPGVASGMILLGAIYFIAMFFSSLYLAPPPEGWVPKGYTDDHPLKKKIRKDLADVTAYASLKTVRFYYLWLMLFINVCCGIALISVAKFMGEQVILLTATAAGIMVMLMSIFNGAGRLIWASLSDKIGRTTVYIIFFAFQIFAFYVLTQTRNQTVFLALVFLILTCYGGGFSNMPALLGDVFGTREVSAIHGYILTAWAVAGLVGPMIIASIRQATGHYVGSLYVFMIFLAAGLIISLLLVGNIKKIKKLNAARESSR